MRKRALAMICLTLSGCLNKYNAPLSADAPAVAGADSRYADALRAGYLACLPIMRPSGQTDQKQKKKDADLRDDRAERFDRNGCTAGIKQDFLDAGLTLSNRYCEDFFRRANATALRRRNARGITNDVGGLVQAVLGLAKVTTGVIGGVGAGVSFADSTFRNYDESFMVDSNLSRMRRMVFAAQDSMRRDFREQDRDDTNFTIFAAEDRITRCAGLCSFLGMKNMLESSLDGTTNQIEKNNTATNSDRNSSSTNGTSLPAVQPAPVKIGPVSRHTSTAWQDARMADGFGGSMPLYLLIAGAMVVLLLAQRFRVVGRIVSFVFMLGALALLAMLIGERGRFDPTFARVASLLNLDRGQQVVGKEMRVPMASDGHFWVTVRFGQVERRMLVDSGATVTALSSATAEAAGLSPDHSPFPMIIQTANGSVRAQTATAPEMRIGNIVARDLPVVTSPAFGDMDVVGMNFLSRLKSWRVEGRTLILTPNHPQPQS